MRIFTLGKKGIPLFLFALILFSGNSSTYAQEGCTPVGETNQFFCDSQEAAVSDLLASQDVTWFADAALTDQLEETERLENDGLYYGSNDGVCPSVVVRATINEMPEILGVTETQSVVPFRTRQSLSTIGLCVADVANPGVFVSDLNTSAANVQWYFGTNANTAVPVDPTAELQNGSYWVEAIAFDEDGNEVCRTNRRRTNVSISSQPAPEGPAIQEFCILNNPTLGSIDASGENAYFASETSEVRLSESTPLEVGTNTYYLTTFGEVCESRERLAVTVTVTPADVVEDPQEFCQVIGTERPTVANLVPADASWFTDAILTVAVNPTDALTDGTTYYQRPDADACAITAVAVTLLDSPNAGSDSAASYCENGGEIDLLASIQASAILGAADANGTFDNDAFEGTVFNTNDLDPGVYNLTYTVPAIGDCAAATSAFTLTILDAPNAGDDFSAEVCSADLPDATAFEAAFTSYLEGRDADGSFGYLQNNYATAGDLAPVLAADFAAGESIFAVTYTVADEACPDSASITLNIVDSPNAGDNGTIEVVERTQNDIRLVDALNGTPVAGGIWTDASGATVEGTFAPQEAGVYTYTVTNGECSATATVTVTVVPNPCPEVVETEQSFCESIFSGNEYQLPTVGQLEPAGATWFASVDATEALDINTELVNGTTYYAGDAEGVCTARESVLVTINDAPSAGATTTITVCENGGTVDLMDSLSNSIIGAADLGGTWSPALASGSSIFDPTVDAAGAYAYTVESNNDVCPDDTAVITVNVTPAPFAGEPTTVALCTGAGPTNLYTFLADGVSTDGTFAGLTDGIFDPAVNQPGEFVYTVEAAGECVGTSTAIITVTVSDSPAAPTASDMSFCASQGATIANLEATGENLLWYTDATLDTLADEADALVSGAYYVTQTSEAGCQSVGTMITVTLTDAPTPTLVSGGNVFCEFDNPTIGTLEANVTASGPITWYDSATGGTILNTSEALENGVSYYASLTNGECESSVRLQVTATLETCELQIPNAFSPNGDSINDTFVIDKLVDEYPNFTIEVYNRWGNIVYKGNARTPAWDGVSTEARSFGDKVLPVGVYFYIVNYNDGQTAPTQGKLYLSR